MKGNITLLIAAILMLMVFGCKKESDVIVQESQIEYNQITEAYFGDSNELTIKANAANAVTLYIDGKETASGANGSIRYNISNLPVGVHTIKIQFVVGGDTFEKSFKCNIIAKPDLYEYVDLGLPSGTLWATCNVGAKNPWDYGDCFEWGETEPKEEYDKMLTYKYYKSYSSDSNEYEFTKYDFNDVFSDALMNLQTEDDVATTKMGMEWCMPTRNDWQELIDNCEIEWTADYQSSGVAGVIVWNSYAHKSHFFLPAAGCSENFNDVYPECYYWSSSLYPDYYDARYAWSFHYYSYSNVFVIAGSYRCDGYFVRAVRKK